MYCLCLTSFSLRICEITYLYIIQCITHRTSVEFKYLFSKLSLLLTLQMSLIESQSRGLKLWRFKSSSRRNVPLNVSFLTLPIVDVLCSVPLRSSRVSFTVAFHSYFFSYKNFHSTCRNQKLNCLLYYMTLKH